jgi:hypothetical protein
VTLPRDTTAGGVLNPDGPGIWLPAMTDDPAWVGNFNWTAD